MCRPRDRFRLIALLAAGSMTVAAQQPSSQPDQPAFRAGVQIVEVDARVFDGSGHFVTDLRREEFELLEDGVPQQLQSMFLVDGSTGAPATSVAPRADAPTGAGPIGRHTWIFLFDLNHLMPGGGFDRARAAVETFLGERFKEGDLGGVVAGSRMVNHRLTTVREELASAAKSIKPLSDRRSRQFEMTHEWPRLRDEDEALRIARDDREAIGRAMSRACSDEPDACSQADLLVREKGRRLARDIHNATLETLRAVTALSSGLAKMAGPKTVVLLSDGFVIEQIETTLRQVVGQTARAGARIYAIDVRGLNRGRGAGLIDQKVVDDEAGGPAAFDMYENGPNSLAVDTGGLMIRNENNIGRALDTILSDTNLYYVLAYQPTNSTFDGKYRTIQVRVKRRDVRVRARRGYLALEPSRMLLPQPLKDRSDAGARSSPPEPTPVEAEFLPPANVNMGTAVVATAAALPASVRVRPDAAQRIDAIASEDRAEGDWRAHRGWDAYQQGNVEAALHAFTEAAARPDARPWVLYALGLSQAALGRYADAAASWERVRRAAPAFEDVYMDLADAYVQERELTKALEVLREAEKRWPANPEIHNAAGVIHVRRGALDEAISAFKKAASAPGESLAHFNLGRAYEMRFVRGTHYVSSQRRWVAPEDDRRKAAEHYQQYLRLGGPYTTQAEEALGRLKWEPSPK